MTVTARLSNTTADKRKKVFSYWTMSSVHCPSGGPCLRAMWRALPGEPCGGPCLRAMWRALPGEPCGLPCLSSPLEALHEDLSKGPHGRLRLETWLQ